MDFENHNNFGSVRKLRDRFEQNNCHYNSLKSQPPTKRYTTDIQQLIRSLDYSDNKLDIKNSRKPEIKAKPKVTNNFCQKLNQTLSNDKQFNATKTRHTFAAPDVDTLEANLVDVSTGHTSQLTVPNPVPKPPRTFAHDVYLELKFNKNKTNFINNSNNNVITNKLSNLEVDKIMALYSKPNKTNKLKDNNRLRSQSDSSVMDKTLTDTTNDNIYDDIIIGKNCDKKFKLKILKHLSCLRLKPH
ncbi:uncharacterized protein LOC128961318 [Oppia nitens]|uniref:uncharacterized protein LOC128961318 n=1 Tax=Oppia nitens TaxID=1686743 RepID=UPI0023DCC292|nr:uncharacterized protein LOC128961318 [Oppia nitens]